MLTDLEAGAKRIRLAELLCMAAELEHGLLCQYLFASFSLRRARSRSGGPSWAQLELIRRWDASLLAVARQEMEHLGLVCNMLTAIGEAPYLQRPNFPLLKSAYPLLVESRLERFGPGALERFIKFEMPMEPTDEERRLLAQALPHVDPDEHRTLGRLYGEIGSLFAELSAHDEQGLFIGPDSAELSDPGDVRGVGVPGGGAYDVTLRDISDNRSAQGAIQQIIVEGEGGPSGATTSHFERFCSISIELGAERARSPAFDPAWPVTGRPLSARFGLASTAALVDLFDLAYETLMLLLARFLSQTDQTAGDVAALQHVTFFPMMTAVIRPLGEIVAQLPLSPHGSTRAGPRFRFERPIALLPHRASAWAIIADRLAQLAGRAQQFAGDHRSYTPAIQARLTLMAENLARMEMDFRTNMATPATAPAR